MESTKAERPNLAGPDFFNAPGFVYFVSAGSGCDACKSIKIGVTVRDRLLGRLKSIQSSNHTRITILGVIECDTMRAAEAREKDLHVEFKELARVQHGKVGYEWFLASPELMTHIKMIAKSPSDLDLKQTKAIMQLFGITESVSRNHSRH